MNKEKRNVRNTTDFIERNLTRIQPCIFEPKKKQMKENLNTEIKYRRKILY